MLDSHHLAKPPRGWKNTIGHFDDITALIQRLRGIRIVYATTSNENEGKPTDMLFFDLLEDDLRAIKATQIKKLSKKPKRKKGN